MRKSSSEISRTWRRNKLACSASKKTHHERIRRPLPGSGKAVSPPRRSHRWPSGISCPELQAVNTRLAFLFFPPLEFQPLAADAREDLHLRSKASRLRVEAIRKTNANYIGQAGQSRGRGRAPRSAGTSSDRELGGHGEPRKAQSTATSLKAFRSVIATT